MSSGILIQKRSLVTPSRRKYVAFDTTFRDSTLHLFARIYSSLYRLRRIVVGHSSLQDFYGMPITVQEVAIVPLQHRPLEFSALFPAERSWGNGRGLWFLRFCLATTGIEGRLRLSLAGKPLDTTTAFNLKVELKLIRPRSRVLE